MEDALRSEHLPAGHDEESPDEKKTHQNALSSGERVSKNFENMTSDPTVLPAFTTVSITPPVVQNLEKN